MRDVLVVIPAGLTGFERLSESQETDLGLSLLLGSRTLQMDLRFHDYGMGKCNLYSIELI